ncbi:hypothetical protein IJ090_01745 [Candidatus Saccharibacteria bacterium]|nr:hypothetical protein [Candidatus Saccharibacteria bacterium]
MDNTLVDKKRERIETLTEDAQESASEGYDTENQLSNNLIAVTLAFVALLAAALSTNSMLTGMRDDQKALIMASVSVFSISIFVGLINYYLNMKAHQKMIRASEERMTRARGVDSSAELRSVRRVVTRPARATNRNNYMIMAQIVLLMVGLALCVGFIGTTLF